MTRVGVVGLGFFGRFHVQAWRNLRDEGVELAAVVDRDDALARATAEEFGVPHWFSDVSEMMEANVVDLVDVASRMQTHLPILATVLATGLPSIVQKPLARDWDDVLRINALAEDNGVFLAVHENFRYQRPFLRVMELLATSDFGPPTWGRFSFRTGLDVYKNQPYFLTEERLAVLDVGIHMIDLAMTVLGPIESVFAEMQARSGRTVAEDTATLLMRHEGAKVSLIECTYEDRRKDGIDTLAEIECENGGISMLPDGWIEIVEGGRARREQVVLPERPWFTPPVHWVQDSVITTCSRIHAAFIAGQRAETDVRQNTRVYAAAEAAYRSSVSRRAERPPA